MIFGVIQTYAKLSTSLLLDSRENADLTFYLLLEKHIVLNTSSCVIRFEE